MSINVSKFVNHIPIKLRNRNSLSQEHLTIAIILGISHPECYGDVINKLRKILWHVHFENQFYERNKSFLKTDYDPVILQRASRLVIDPSTVDSHAFLFGCAVTDRV